MTNFLFLSGILVMSALFSDAPISTRKNGFTLFMELDMFSHINLRKSSL